MGVPKFLAIVGGKLDVSVTLGGAITRNLVASSMPIATAPSISGAFDLRQKWRNRRRSAHKGNPLSRRQLRFNR